MSYHVSWATQVHQSPHTCARAELALLATKTNKTLLQGRMKAATCFHNAQGRRITLILALLKSSCIL
jgi:hypothetical protein